ncbi:MAG TPA: branched-chain amino acid ABC transporter permease, partial [Anaerolineales bacterium]|nr:branched-chain amino acid ABC transporter permease [Anaerolineales bacterium]
MDFLLQQLVNALQSGSFYALIAIGYSMVYSVLMLFNFAHGDVFMVGAYIGFFVSSGLLGLELWGVIGLPVGVQLGLILVLTLIVSMFLNSLVGMAVERIGYRPLRGAPRASAAITGLMIGIILENGNLALLGPQRLSFPELIPTATLQLGSVSLTNKKIMIVAVSLLLTLAFHMFVRRTKWGMAMRAMAYDFVVVPLMGISINKIALMTFALGSALAA